MKLSEALTLIEKLYGWELSKEQQKIFVDLMRQTKNPQQVIDNWAIYRKEHPNKSPLIFKQWFSENVNVEIAEKQQGFPTMKWERRG